MKHLSNIKGMDNNRWLIGGLLVVLLLLYVGMRTTNYFEIKARETVVNQSRGAATILSSHLKSEINKFETGVTSLARIPAITEVIHAPDQLKLRRAEAILSRYNDALGGNISYLLDEKGLCIASSNSTAADSFVGNSYYFRPYFQEAIKGNPYRYMSLGITTGIRGLYMSHPLKNDKGEPIGVVTIKKNLEYVEATISQYPYCFVVSPEGVIFLSSEPALTFNLLWPISSDERSSLEINQQFGWLQQSSIFPNEIEDASCLNFVDIDYYASRISLDITGWSIILLTSVEQIKFYKYAGISLTAALCCLTILVFFFIHTIQKDRALILQSEALYKTLAEKSFTSIHILTEDHQCAYVNPEGVEHTGYSQKELLQMDINDLVHPDDREEAKAMLVEMGAGRRAEPFECRIITKNGGVEWVLRNSSPIKYKNRPAFLVHSLVITERKKLEQQAQLQAYTDQMTGLLNRRGLMIHADQMMAMSQRSGERFFLLFMDMDGLKRINDNLGHHIGDKAIIELAHVLKEGFRESDIVARIGGDEFVALTQSDGKNGVDKLIDRLHQNLEVRNLQEGREYNVSVSVGKSSFDPKNPISFDKLLLQADQIMYRAKAQKK